MEIWVDADACPVNHIIEKIAAKYYVPLTFVSDTNHQITCDYGKVIMIDPGKEAVDVYIANHCKEWDLVITQDYGVAAMVLGKKAFAMHQNGFLYTNNYIDLLLMERYAAMKARNSRKKSHLPGPRKRTEDDDQKFEKTLEHFLENHWYC